RHAPGRHPASSPRTAACPLGLGSGGPTDGDPGGATALRLAGQIGAIAVGMRADLVLYDLTAPPWVPLNDPVQHLVHVEDGHAVAPVLINGRIIVEQGRVTTVDAAALIAEARPMLAAIRARNAAFDQVARRVAAVMP